MTCPVCNGTRTLKEVLESLELMEGLCLGHTVVVMKMVKDQ